MRSGHHCFQRRRQGLPDGVGGKVQTTGRIATDQRQQFGLVGHHSAAGQQRPQIDEFRRGQRRQKLGLEKLSHDLVVGPAFAEPRNQQWPAAGVAHDAHGIAGPEMRGDLGLAEQQIAGPNDGCAAIGQRPRQAGQDGLAPLGDHDAAAS